MAHIRSLLALPAFVLVATHSFATQFTAQEAYLKASNSEEDDHFGFVVEMSGDTIIVGARGEDSSAVGVNGNQLDNSVSLAGAAYVFVRSGTTWTQQAYLKSSNPEILADFGISVAIDGDIAAVGAYREDNATSSEVGAVYVFARNGTVWTEEACIKASNQGSRDFFGGSVALSGDTLVVGAFGEDSNATGVNGNQFNGMAFQSGAAYVFVRNGTNWNQQAYLKASNTDPEDYFGFRVDISGDLIVVGAHHEDSSATGVNGDESNNDYQGLGNQFTGSAGAAYVFARNGTDWSQQAYLKASNSSFLGSIPDQFGRAVAISGTTIIVGARGEDSNATGTNGDDSNNSISSAGAAYVFTQTGTTWAQEAYLKASYPDEGDLFGDSVSIDGDTIFVGAMFEDGSSVGIDGNQASNGNPVSGAAYQFVRNGTNWSQAAYIKASNTGTDDRFAASVSVSGNAAVVGAFGEYSSASGVDGDQQDNSGGFLTGAAYVFDLNAPPPAPELGTSHCSGDGGDQMGCTNCPCSNNALPGTVAGCLNSIGDGAQLMAEGSTSVSLLSGATDDLRFSLNGVPDFSFCVLTSGDEVAPTNPMNPCFGMNSGIQAMQFDGLRCAVSGTRRHGGRPADNSGTVGVSNAPWGGEGGPPAGIAQAGGGFAAGQNRFFQVIYRDDDSLACMTGLNTSQAVEILFTP